MKNYLLLIVLVVCGSSCSVDEPGFLNKQTNDLSLEKQFHSKSAELKNCDRTVSGNTIESLVGPFDCEEDFELEVITEESAFQIGNNSEGFIDSELEEVFHKNWRFNVRMIKRGEPTLVSVKEFIYEDSQVLNEETFELENEHLNDPVSAESANIIKQRIACQIKSSIETGHFPYDIDIIGDIALCGGDALLVVRYNVGY